MDYRREDEMPRRVGKKAAKAAFGGLGKKPKSPRTARKATRTLYKGFQHKRKGKK